MSKTSFHVRFWGARGSIPSPGPDTVRYGGNTSCVEVRCDSQLVVFDGGTGLRLLGNELAGAPLDADIFYSHCHIDHICGLPCFAPAFLASSKLRLWAGNLLPNYTLEKTLRDFLGEPATPS